MMIHHSNAWEAFKLAKQGEAETLRMSSMVELDALAYVCISLKPMLQVYIYNHVTGDM